MMMLDLKSYPFKYKMIKTFRNGFYEVAGT